MERWSNRLSEARMTPRTRLALHLLIVAICLFAPACGLIWSRYNWDMLAYIGIVKSWHTADFATAHAQTYEDARLFAQHWGLTKAYGLLVDPAQPYRLASFKDPQIFYEQLPFYRIRPVYLLLLDAVSRLTGSVAGACVFVSVGAALALNTSLAIFAHRRCGTAVAALLLAVICTSPALIWVAQVCTADGLTALCVALAAMAYLSGAEILAAAFLAGGIGVRSDLMVLNGVMAAAMALGALASSASASLLRRIAPVLLPCALLAASVLAAQAIGHWAGAYNYHTLFHVTFMEGFDAHPARFAASPIPPRRMVTAIAEGVAEGFANGGFGAVLACVLALGVAGLRDGLARREALLTGVLLGTFLLRLAVFPSPDVRLTAPIFVGLAVVVIAVAGRMFFFEKKNQKTSV